jgi:hypothetical protein
MNIIFVVLLEICKMFKGQRIFSKAFLLSFSFVHEWLSYNYQMKETAYKTSTIYKSLLKETLSTAEHLKIHVFIQQQNSSKAVTEFCYH